MKNLIVPAMLALAVLFTACEKKKNEATSVNSNKEIALFNGENLDGWGFVLQDDSRAEEVFTVKEGMIHIAGSPFGYMYTQEKFDNFTLDVEWCWPEEATNSGIFLFIQDDLNVWPKAIECQLCAGNAGDFVLLAGSDMKEYVVPEGQERPEYPIVEKQHPSNEKPVGEWNHAQITCVDGKITAVINGLEQNVGTASLYQSGRIALQSEGKDILFRNVKVTKL